MLSKNVLVTARHLLEKEYIGKCTITEQTKVENSHHVMEFKSIDVLTDQPCRLSFSRSSAASDGEASNIRQTVKLFISPDIMISEGSRITVTQNGRTVEYRRSGPAAVYGTHQEIELELLEERA